jgi:hypothetical protein
VTPEHAAKLARLLAVKGWVPIQDIPFPSLEEHEEVCARLGLDPKLGQEEAVTAPESEGTRGAPPGDGQPEGDRG